MSPPEGIPDLSKIGDVYELGFGLGSDKPQTSALIKKEFQRKIAYQMSPLEVLVVANPANTNALIFKEFAPSIPPRNITCLTRLDHNRATGQISERLNVQVSGVKKVTIRGNHSSTQYPDVSHATVETPYGDIPVLELLPDDGWLRGEFITTVKQRGDAIIRARKLSSALSAASSVCDLIRDWVLGTPEELGFPWEFTPMVHTMCQLVSFIHSQSLDAMENGQSFKDSPLMSSLVYSRLSWMIPFSSFRVVEQSCMF